MWDGVLVKDSMWAFPREGSAKEQMRKCYENMTDSDLSGVEMINLERITKNLHERFSEQTIYEQFVKAVNFVWEEEVESGLEFEEL